MITIEYYLIDIQHIIIVITYSMLAIRLNPSYLPRAMFKSTLEDK